MKKWNLVVGNKAKAKVLSVLLAVTMSFSLFGCGQTASDKSNEEASAAASEVEAEADAAASEAKATPSHSSESGKDETVYIVTDASGNPTNITVNDQLKNKDGAATLVDKTDLKDIVNVNGDGSYTENSDGTITWETESADVYYQGTTDKTLPVTVSLSYQLDGKDIRPEDLAGKSGHVKIRFDYKNTATMKEKVGGKEEDVTVPFAMISGRQRRGCHGSVRDDLRRDSSDGQVHECLRHERKDYGRRAEQYRRRHGIPGPEGCT